MHYKYEIIIYWSKNDNAYLAEVAELDGCKSNGQIYQEAISNVELIVGDWIETVKLIGRKISKPNGKLMYP